MTIQCKDLDTLLFEGDALALETAARHAEGCAECMERLTTWNEISDTARSLQTSWKSDTLWPRIERALREEKRASSAQLWRIAAAVVLTISLAGLTIYALRVHARDAAFDRVILPIAAFDEVERAETAHLKAIETLEALAEPRLEEETPLMVSYKEKLMLLDDAIAECETNIERNQQNAHLRKQLLSMYSEKQRTLQQVVREGNHVSTQ